MSETVESEPVESSGQVSSAVSDEQFIAMLVGRARGEGPRLTGEGGMLQLTNAFIDESRQCFDSRGMGGGSLRWIDRPAWTPVAVPKFGSFETPR